MNQAFLDYFRCPASFIDFQLADEHRNGHRPGYFEFGPGLVCYGVARQDGSKETSGAPRDVLEQVRIEGSTCVLPFDPTEVANNLRYERYVDRTPPPLWKSSIRKLYYAMRPVMPVPVRRHFQRQWLKGWKTKPFPQWPVDKTVDRMFETLMRLALQASPEKRIPFVWFWPEGKASCAIMTHDVETAAGLQFAGELMNINESFDIRSSFQIIPDARYTVTEEVLSAIRNRGFEVNVHDLKHDGHLFDNHDKFLESATRINEFAKRFGSKGYRSGVLYRNLEWYDAFNFSYDMSVPNVAHLDPQPGGCCTVMPYFVGDILELPVTTTQDYSLFNVLQTFSQDLWREQISHIMQQHGMVSFIVHPDYLNTSEARDAYRALLHHLSTLRAEAELWIALPREVDSWWRQRNAMKLVPEKNSWRIEGAGSERARIAYATLKNNKLTYQFA